MLPHAAGMSSTAIKCTMFIRALPHGVICAGDKDDLGAPLAHEHGESLAAHGIAF